MSAWTEIIWTQSLDDELAEYGIDSDSDDFNIAAHLAQWDYGDETDLAHPIEAEVLDQYYGDVASEHEIGGLTYHLMLNRGLGYAGLYRRPLSQD